MGLALRKGVPDELRRRLGAGVSRAWTAVATGLSPLDELLAGGMPKGRLVELIGGRASCATSVAVHVMAAATARGEVVAIIDGPDAFDPRSAREAGLDLARTLWVRPKTMKDGVAATDLVLGAGDFGVVVLDLFEKKIFHHGEYLFVRLARAAERSRTVLVVIASCHVAGTFATLTLTCRRERVVVTRSKVGPPGGEANIAWRVPRVH